MTEAEWLACTDPLKMLEFLRCQASDRKLRLFACACCRRIWGFIKDERSRNAVEVAERFADGLMTEEELAIARLAAETVVEATGQHSAWTATGPPNRDANWAAWCAARNSLRALQEPGQPRMFSAEEIIEQARLLQDIFGLLPFRPATMKAEWLAWNDGTVVDLAQAIYKDRIFNHLPILADALEEAGCTDHHILDHCRQRGEHVRGCWVVDLILAKK
jgi:hypothetical protein